MDTSDRNISFDRDGLCNHCRQCDLAARRLTRADPEQVAATLDRIRAAGAGRDHDCVIGLSGGIDSSTVAWIAVRELGLRPLAVHLDNGWNSTAAVLNIHRLVRTLGLELVTHVIDWEEFRDLQRAYLYASVIDVDAITDHAIRALLYSTADARGIPFILSGSNDASEAILPIGWGFNNVDVVNIRAIHRRFGSRPLDTFPQLGGARLRGYWRRGITELRPLDWRPYDRSAAKRLLAAELDWQDYGGKHCESLFTRFYQGHLLVAKFGIDKRRAHLSTLINHGQATRADALAELATPPYTPRELESDLDYVAKKLALPRAELERVIATSPRSHFEFDTELESKLRHLVYPRVMPLYRELRDRVESVLPLRRVLGGLRARRRTDPSTRRTRSSARSGS